LRLSAEEGGPQLNRPADWLMRHWLENRFSFDMHLREGRLSLAAALILLLPAARPCGPGPRLTMRWKSPCPWTMITPGEFGDVGGAAATTSKNAQSLCRCANPTPRTAPAST